MQKPRLAHFRDALVLASVLVAAPIFAGCGQEPAATPAKSSGDPAAAQPAATPGEGAQSKGTPPATDSAQATWVVYTLPGWMLCNNNGRMVHAVEAKHPGKFKVDLRPRDSHLDELKAHGIESHGVVCVNNAGETLWKHADHKMSQAELDKGVTAVLAKLPK